MIKYSSVTDLLFSLLPAAAGTLLHDLTLILALLFSLLGSRVSLRDWHSHYMSRNDRRTNAAQPLRRKHLKTVLKWRAALWTTTRDDSMFNTPQSRDIIFCQQQLMSVISNPMKCRRNYKLLSILKIRVVKNKMSSHSAVYRFKTTHTSSATVGSQITVMTG